MTSVLALFLDICLLRRGPERVPAAPLFLALVFALDLLVSVVLQGIGNDSELAWRVSRTALWMCVLGICLWLLLAAQGRNARLPASFAAVLGADALITLVMGSAVLLLAGSPRIANVIALLGQLWWLAVLTFVLRRALEVPVGISAALAVLTYLCTVVAAAAALGDSGT